MLRFGGPEINPSTRSPGTDFSEARIDFNGLEVARKLVRGSVGGRYGGSPRAIARIDSMVLRFGNWLEGRLEGGLELPPRECSRVCRDVAARR